METQSSHLIASYLQHQAGLRQHLLRHVGCSDTADDLLHDTFIRIAQLAVADDIVNPRAFLYRVAGNLALDHLRRETRRQSWDTGPSDDEWPCPTPQPDRQVESQQQWRAVMCWLQTLPLSNRQMLLSYRLEGKTQRQIASEMHRSLRQVEQTLSWTQQALGTTWRDAG